MKCERFLFLFRIRLHVVFMLDHYPPIIDIHNFVSLSSLSSWSSFLTEPEFQHPHALPDVRVKCLEHHLVMPILPAFTDAAQCANSLIWFAFMTLPAHPSLWITPHICIYTQISLSLNVLNCYLVHQILSVFLTARSSFVLTSNFFTSWFCFGSQPSRYRRVWTTRFSSGARPFSKAPCSRCCKKRSLENSNSLPLLLAMAQLLRPRNNEVSASSPTVLNKAAGSWSRHFQWALAWCKCVYFQIPTLVLFPSNIIVCCVLISTFKCE